MDEAAIRITHTGGYQFAIDFGEAWPSLTADEPAPIGTGAGPSPEHLVAAGVANCLSASLVFALGKYRAKPSGLGAEARFKVHRNAAGRLRMESITVTITLDGVSNADAATRALAKFQDFCTVSESVAAGIPIAVSVVDPAGKVLHRSPGETAGAAARPEDAPAAFVERANRGDIDGLLALYDGDLVLGGGTVASTGAAVGGTGTGATGSGAEAPTGTI